MPKISAKNGKKSNTANRDPYPSPSTLPLLPAAVDNSSMWERPHLETFADLLHREGDDGRCMFKNYEFIMSVSERAFKDLVHKYGVPFTSYGTLTNNHINQFANMDKTARKVLLAPVCGGGLYYDRARWPLLLSDCVVLTRQIPEALNKLCHVLFDLNADMTDEKWFAFSGGDSGKASDLLSRLNCIKTDMQQIAVDANVRLH